MTAAGPPITREMLKQSLVLTLAGGVGERLSPLTRDRAKPAVPFGGTYRIIDFPLSNCLNSGFHRICVLTQYKSISLSRHLAAGWRIFPLEQGEFLETIPPQQRTGEHWYLGTADAIYQNIYTLEKTRPRWVIILAADHVYSMNYCDMLSTHLAHEADLTIACIQVPRTDASRLGVVTVDATDRIVEFNEKPDSPAGLPNDPEHSLASMGIYIFNTEMLVRRVINDAKRQTSHDFGKDIIPEMVHAADRVFAFNFRNPATGQACYWRDIGTIDAYWQANMDLTDLKPEYDLHNKAWPIRTSQEQHPPAKTCIAAAPDGVRQGTILNSLVSAGCVITGAQVERSVLSPAVTVDYDSEIVESVVMEGVTVGKGAKIRRAIIDKEVRIPDGCKIGYDGEEDRRRFTVTDTGIVVVPKGMPVLA